MRGEPCQYLGRKKPQGGPRRAKNATKGAGRTVRACLLRRGKRGETRGAEERPGQGKHKIKKKKKKKKKEAENHDDSGRAGGKKKKKGSP